MNCIICETETGSDKRRTCSGSCRAKAHRQRTRTPDIVAHTVERTQLVKGGVCWCCGAEIESILVCCGSCAWSGRAKAKRAGVAPPRIGAELALHSAIIRTINRLTTNQDGTVDEQARITRMANAMHYEQVCPGRPYTGTGL